MAQWKSQKRPLRRIMLDSHLCLFLSVLYRSAAAVFFVRLLGGIWPANNDNKENMLR